MSNGQQAWTLYLPFATKVYIYGYTNAAYSQKIVSTFENGNVLTMSGQGEGNQPTNPAVSVLTTPSTGSHLNGYQVSVVISAQKGGSWVVSQLAGAGCSLGFTAATYLVVSEDLVDADWNDGVLQFLWYNPPSVRNAALSARDSVRAEADSEATGPLPAGPAEG
jgi:fucose-binding lectin II (PA-IIL)